MSETFSGSAPLTATSCQAKLHLAWLCTSRHDMSVYKELVRQHLQITRDLWHKNTNNDTVKALFLPKKVPRYFSPVILHGTRHKVYVISFSTTVGHAGL